MSDIDPSLLVDLLHESMQKGHRPLLTVIGNSMAPLLRHGDQVRVEPAGVTQLQPGDVVTMTAASHLLTHRYWGTVTEAEKVYLITRGDRPLTLDAPWPAPKLVGRVVARRRQGYELPLATGLGGWLNRHIASLVTAELRWLTGDDSSLVEQQISPRQQRTIPVRLLRRAFFAWTSLWVGMVGVIVRFGDRRSEIGDSVDPKSATNCTNFTN